MKIARRPTFLAAAAVSALALPASGLTFSSAQSGNYNANTTWGAATNPGGGLVADDVTINTGHTVTVTVAGDTNLDTITVLSGGILRQTANIDHATGANAATVHLVGGTINYTRNGGNTLGWNIVVDADSAIQLNRSSGSSSSTYTFGTLDFGTQDGNVLTFSRGGGDTPSTATAVFTNSDVVLDGTIRFAVGEPVVVNLAGLSLASGATLTAETEAGAAYTGRVNVSGTNTGLEGTIVIGSGTTLLAANAGALGSGTFVVEGGGQLRTEAEAETLGDATIRLTGGTLNHTRNGSTVVGGNVIVDADSTLQLNRSGGTNNITITFNSFGFGSDGHTLTVTKNHTTNSTGVFNAATIEHSGTLDIVESNSFINLTDMTVSAGSTLSKTGDGTLRVLGDLGVKLAGSAQILDADTFTLVSANSNLTKNFTGQTTNGLWSFGGDANTITAALAKDLGSVGVGQMLDLGGSFDSGYVTLTGLTDGLMYSLQLGLDSFASDMDSVINELLTNPFYDSVTALDADTVALGFTSTLTGDAYFAWDNVTGLGANVTGLSLLVPSDDNGDAAGAAVPEPTTALLGLVGLAGLAARRRR